MVNILSVAVTLEIALPSVAFEFGCPMSVNLESVSRLQTCIQTVIRGNLLISYNR